MHYLRHHLMMPHTAWRPRVRRNELPRQFEFSDIVRSMCAQWYCRGGYLASGISIAIIVLGRIERALLCAQSVVGLCTRCNRVR